MNAAHSDQAGQMGELVIVDLSIQLGGRPTPHVTSAMDSAVSLRLLLLGAAGLDGFVFCLHNCSAVLHAAEEGAPCPCTQMNCSHRTVLHL